MTKTLEEALENLLKKYVDGANSGDWGNWDPEKQQVVIDARAALSEAQKGKNFSVPQGYRIVRNNYDSIFKAVGDAVKVVPDSNKSALSISVRKFWESLDTRQPEVVLDDHGNESISVFPL